MRSFLLLGQQTSKFKKKRVEPEAHVLTQEELLAEAAQTEIENIRSLQARLYPVDFLHSYCRGLPIVFVHF